MFSMSLKALVWQARESESSARLDMSTLSTFQQCVRSFSDSVNHLSEALERAVHAKAERDKVSAELLTQLNNWIEELSGVRTADISVPQVCGYIDEHIHSTL